MAEKIISLVSGIPIEWQIFVLAMFPITELRAAIPYGIALGVPPGMAMGMAVLGNFLIAIPVLIILRPAINLLSKLPVAETIISKVLQKTRKKGGKVAKYGVVGLALFVAFPIPGTGVWTGSLLAFLFGINFISAMLALGGGIIISATIVTLLSIGMIDLLGLPLPWVLAIIVGLILAFYIASYLLKLKVQKV